MRKAFFKSFSSFLSVGSKMNLGERRCRGRCGTSRRKCRRLWSSLSKLHRKITNSNKCHLIALKIVFKKANWKEEFLYFWRFRLWFYLSRSYGFPLTGMVLQVNGAQIDITGGIKKCPEKHVKDIFFTWWHMQIFLKCPKFEHFQILSVFLFEFSSRALFLKCPIFICSIILKCPIFE